MAAIAHATLLAAIRQCVTVVEPGEILAVRVSASIDDFTLDMLNEQAARVRELHGVAVLFLAAEEFARLRGGGAP